jgi:hypothetical protein
MRGSSHLSQTGTDKRPLQTFSKKELPEKHRIVKPGQMMTRDFRVDRLNVHVNDDNIVTKVNFG